MLDKFEQMKHSWVNNAKIDQSRKTTASKSPWITAQRTMKHTKNLIQKSTDVKEVLIKKYWNVEDSKSSMHGVWW